MWQNDHSIVNLASPHYDRQGYFICRLSMTNQQSEECHTLLLYGNKGIMLHSPMSLLSLLHFSDLHIKKNMITKKHIIMFIAIIVAIIPIFIVFDVSHLEMYCIYVLLARPA
jgi:hypothetical protein